MAYLATTGTRTKDEKGTQGGDNDCVAGDSSQSQERDTQSSTTSYTEGRTSGGG
jgi:hypothetical protein